MELTVLPALKDLRDLPGRLERMVPTVLTVPMESPVLRGHKDPPGWPEQMALMAQQALRDRLVLPELMELLVCRVFKDLLDPQVHRV